MTPGLLSVILPNFNHAAYVAGQISAVLNQSYRNIELLIVDDTSTDNSIEVIEAAIKGDSRAKLIRNEKNLGVVMNVEKGRSLCKGEYLYFAAADDQILPGLFEKSVGLLQQFPEAGMCLSNPSQMDVNTGQVYANCAYLNDGPAYFSPEALCDAMYGGDGLGGGCVVFRHAAYEQAMPPLDSFKKLEWHSDWFVLGIIASRQGMCYIPETLSVMRLMPGQYSQQGAFNWERQKPVIQEIFRLLKSDAYRDVWPCFAQCGFFSHVPLVARYVMFNSDLWDPVTMMLVQKQLLDFDFLKRQQQQNRSQQVNQRKTLGS